jgi:hypothetical protein
MPLQYIVGKCQRFVSIHVVLLLIIALNSRPVSALLGFEDHAFPEFITSSRALSMGNAFICKTDDPWAVFYNPAGLGTVRGVSIHPGNLHLETNKGFFNVSEGQAEDISKKISKNFSAEKLNQNLRERPDNMVHTRANLFPNITGRYFSLGYLYSKRVRAAYDSETSIYEFAEREDHGPLAGLNVSLFGGVLKFGASGVYLRRKQLQKDFTSTDPVTVEDSEYKRGEAFIGTVGGRLTLPFVFLPTFAAVLRNSGAVYFHRVEQEQDPPERIEQTLDLGFSLTPQIGQRSRIHLEVNLRDVHNRYQTEVKRRLGGGMEFDVSRTFFLRLGYGDGFGSGGIGIRTKKVLLDLTTYAVDNTASSYRGEEDRRFVFSISTGI